MEPKEQKSKEQPNVPTTVKSNSKDTKNKNTNNKCQELTEARHFLAFSFGLAVHFKRLAVPEILPLVQVGIGLWGQHHWMTSRLAKAAKLRRRPDAGVTRRFGRLGFVSEAEKRR